MEIARLPHRRRTTLMSRNGNPFRSFPDMASLLSFEVNADDAVLDGEIVKLDDNDRPQFYDLLRPRGPFAFVAFDVLALNGTDVRKLSLIERKRLLRAVVPSRSSTISTTTHIAGRGLRRTRPIQSVCRRLSSSMRNIPSLQHRFPPRQIISDDGTRGRAHRSILAQWMIGG